MIRAAMRVELNTGDHVRVGVFLGEPGSRVYCGSITMRLEEWGQFGKANEGAIAVVFDLLPSNVEVN